MLLLFFEKQNFERKPLDVELTLTMHSDRVADYAAWFLCCDGGFETKRAALTRMSIDPSNHAMLSNRGLTNTAIDAHYLTTAQVRHI